MKAGKKRFDIYMREAYERLKECESIQGYPIPKVIDCSTASYTELDALESEITTRRPVLDFGEKRTRMFGLVSRFTKICPTRSRTSSAY